MKVIQRGREQTGWSIQKTCTGAGNGSGGCGAILLVEKADVFSTESHARDETTRYATFKCCECGVMTDLCDKEVPSKLWRGMKSRKEWEGPA